jgi:predicted AlkP superfamily pyrophosphatase or phosphodiesterase
LVKPNERRKPMWNEPSVDELKKIGIPKLYETDFISPESKHIFAHFFVGSADWYIAEFDGDDLFFGYANLGDDANAEWGYISFSELKILKLRNGIEVDYDLHWRIKKASEIKKIIFR